jgi:hypothetical protein
LAIPRHDRKTSRRKAFGHNEQADLRGAIAARDFELGQGPRHRVRGVVLHLDNERGAREDAFVGEAQQPVADLAAGTSADNAAEVIDNDRRAAYGALDEAWTVVLERVAAAGAARVTAPSLFESSP